MQLAQFSQQQKQKRFSIPYGSRTFENRFVLAQMGFANNKEARSWDTDDENAARSAALIVGCTYVSNTTNSTASASSGNGSGVTQESAQSTTAFGDDPHGDESGDQDAEASSETDAGEADRAESAGEADIAAENDGSEALQDDEDDRRDVDSLTAREAVAVLKRLKAERAVKIGDYARMTADERAARIIANLPDPQERQAYIASTPGVDAPGGTPDASKPRRGRPPKNRAGANAQITAAASEDEQDFADEQDADQNEEQPMQASPKPEAPRESAAENDMLDEEFTKRQARAIREHVADHAPVDEEAIRVIAREVAREENEALTEKLADGLAQTMSQLLTEANGKVSEYIDEKLANVPQNGVAFAQPRDIRVQIGTREAVVTTGMHYLASKCAALLSWKSPHDGKRLSVYGAGAAAVGKSTMGRHIAELLGVPYHGLIGLSGGTTEAVLIGKSNPIDKSYQSTQTMRAYEHGGVISWDELDAADPTVVIVCNGMLANDFATIEARATAGLEPVVTKHDDFVNLGWGNTVGLGATGQYAARQALDGAFLDRYYFLQVDYDAHIIARMIGASGAPQEHAKPAWTPDYSQAFDQDERNAWQAWWWNMHTALNPVGQARKSNRVWSPRTLLRVDAARSVGVSRQETLEDVFASWKPDERAKLGFLAQGPVFSA